VGRGRVVAWVAFGVTCAAAILLTLTAPKLASSPPASEDVQKSVFSSLASDEVSMRRTAAKGFPADPWSQDDDFHNQELRRVNEQASSRHVSAQSLLRGVDEGMRAGWAKAPAAKVRVTVPPCRPRPIY
jgi:hypothetical protein